SQNSAQSNDGSKSSSTTPEQSKTEFQFDANGFPTAITLSGAASSVDTPSNGSAPFTVHYYNDSGLLEKIEFAEGGKATFIYDPGNACFRARKNLTSMTLDPGTRGGDPLTASWSNYDLHYNLPRNETDFNNKSINLTLTSDKREIKTFDYGAGAVRDRTID